MLIGYNDSKITVSKDYNGSAEQVWKIITDTHLWPEWGPSVTTVQCDRRYINVGSKGRIRTAVGFWLPFYISRYKDMRCWVWQVGGIEATGHHIYELTEDRTRLTFSMPWWSAPYLLICMLALQRIKKLLLRRMH